MNLLVQAIIVVVALGVAYFWHTVNLVPPIPKLERTWWGAGEPRQVDESIRPFTINISDKVLEDLERRLEFHVELTPPLEGVNFEYGFNTDYLKEVINFWRKDYKWREREVFLNKFPHFKTRVSGLDLHFIHVKPTKVPEGTRVLPMMLLHGWPGSVRDFYSLIPLLTKPRNGFVFEVVVPSLPGYGFSEGASKPGLGEIEMAVVIHNLMERIGHTKYYIQGGDWGALIGTYLSTIYPQNVIGLHVNMCLVGTFKSVLKTLIGTFLPKLVIDDDHAHLMYPLKNKLERFVEETGYMHIQSTKPDTIGVALRDSPVGLAAYILEKMSTWTNPHYKHLPDGGLTKKFTVTDLLDNVMIYWVTGSITTSMRLYSETFNVKEHAHGFDYIPCRVPTACAMFPNELIYQSEFLLKEKYPNMVQYTQMPRGGHFAALEEAVLLADDVWEAVDIIENKRRRN